MVEAAIAAAGTFEHMTRDAARTAAAAVGLQEGGDQRN